MIRKQVSIGIPAFNEEANIGFLLKDILRQRKDGFRIREIIISSDGSTDRTVDTAAAFNNEKIKILNNPDRKGISRGLNQICQKAGGDFLVILNADIKIKDRLFLKKLLAPMNNDGADMVCAAVMEITTNSFVSRMIALSMRIKQILFEMWRQGSNLYTAHGQARAFSRRMYKKIVFPNSAGDDMYSYLICINNNFKYHYAKNALIYYVPPVNIHDHSTQSVRFWRSIKQQEKYFPPGLVKKEIYISPAVYLTAFVKAVPLIVCNLNYFISYILVVFYTKVAAVFSGQVKSNWKMATSTKIINKTSNI